jgi:catechol 2,3-dioxygenase-like lactoylglutathione lyase family enzyme
MAIAHVTLPTRDLRRTVAFFEATLGWRPIDRPGNVAVPSAWLQIAPGQELHLLELPDFEPSRFEREYGRHVAVSFPSEGFSALKQRLEEQGVQVITAERPTPFERFFFRDFNGYMFEVVAAER